MDGLIFLVPLGGMATGAVFLIVVYKLVAKWMDLRHRPGLPGVSPEELDELRHDLVAMRDLPARVTDLEERLDFAERLLTRGGDAGGADAGRT